MKMAAGRVIAILGLAMAMAAGAPETGRCGEGSIGTGVVEHTVVKGDHLMLIAGFYYKDPRQWREIYTDNGDVLGDPNHLVPGTVLKVRNRRGSEWSISYEEFSRLAGN